jgi:Zn-dependent protease with chaperone function
MTWRVRGQPTWWARMASMARVSLYPPSPDDVPADLTAPPPKYRLQVFVVLVCLFVFLLLYVSLIVGSAILIWWCLTTTPNPFLYLVAGLAGMLFLFLLKGFFKRQRAAKSYDIEVFEEDHPRLFDFITRLCDETGAPFPNRVFVNFEVNASASYNASILNLFWPSKKNLTLGLGLVNVINLTEFKAVLAHEFGHFSQNSMRMGHYVYMARKIMLELIYGRDFFDDFLDRWCSLDIRISFIAWGFYGLLWSLRMVLTGLHHAIFFIDKALSRQMEFNADLVAVSVTGSDAPVHLLAKCIYGSDTLDQALRELQAAADHKLYTSNLFFHQNHAAAFIRRRKKDPSWGELVALPSDPRRSNQVFDPEDDGDLPVMWLDHPPNSEREANCKEEYIRTHFDERSPWLLFDEVDDLRERVTWKFYRVVFKVPKNAVLADAEEIQAFIDEEHAETTYDPRYHGAYDNRILDLGGVEDLAQLTQRQPWTINQLAHTHATLYGVDVKHRMQLHNRKLEDYEMLTAILNGRRPKNDEIDFRGELYDPRDAKRLLKKVDKELEQDQAWLTDLDRKVFSTHYQMALHLESRVARDLVERYRFHLGVQQIWKNLRSQEGSVGAALQFLEGKRKLDHADFKEALSIFRKAHRTLADSLEAARDLVLPPLKNMTPGEPLRPFLLQKKLVHGLDRDEMSLRGDWIDKLLTQINEVQQKVNRIHFKSLGGILAVQEQISARCLAQWQSLPTAAVIEEPQPKS